MSFLSKLARAMGLADDPAAVPSNPRIDAAEPHDDRTGSIAMGADGRYHAAGYSFTSEQQALDFLRRRTSPAEPASRISHPSLQPARRLEAEQRPAYRERPAMHTHDRSAVKGSAVRWIAGPSRETVAGITFDAHLVYVGKRDEQTYPRNQSAIDPARPVGNRDDPDGHTVT